jgi:hypothetical protein
MRQHTAYHWVAQAHARSAGDQWTLKGNVAAAYLLHMLVQCTVSCHMLPVSRDLCQTRAVTRVTQSCHAPSHVRSTATAAAAAHALSRFQGESECMCAMEQQLRDSKEGMEGYLAQYDALFRSIQHLSGDLEKQLSANAQLKGENSAKLQVRLLTKKDQTGLCCGAVMPLWYRQSLCVMCDNGCS